MSLRHIILGLLSRKPMSGYDLNQTFRQTAYHFWTTDHTQIYRALHKMHDAAWVDVELIQQAGAPDKKIYHVTEAGQAELARWLREPVPDAPIREAWLGQLFFGDSVALEDTLRNLKVYHGKVTAALQALQMIDEQVFQQMNMDAAPLHLWFQYLTLDYGIMLHQHILTWLEETIAAVERKMAR